MKRIDKKKTGTWEDIIKTTNEDFYGRMGPMLIGTPGILGKQAGEANKSNSNTNSIKWQNGRRLNGKTTSTSRALPRTRDTNVDRMFDAEFEKKSACVHMSM